MEYVQIIDGDGNIQDLSSLQLLASQSEGYQNLNIQGNQNGENIIIQTEEVGLDSYNTVVYVDEFGRVTQPDGVNQQASESELSLNQQAVQYLPVNTEDRPADENEQIIIHLIPSSEGEENGQARNITIPGLENYVVQATPEANQPAVQHGKGNTEFQTVNAESPHVENIQILAQPETASLLPAPRQTSSISQSSYTPMSAGHSSTVILNANDQKTVTTLPGISLLNPKPYVQHKLQTVGKSSKTTNSKQLKRSTKSNYSPRGAESYSNTIVVTLDEQKRLIDTRKISDAPQHLSVEFLGESCKKPTVRLPMAVCNSRYMPSGSVNKLPVEEQPLARERRERSHSIINSKNKLTKARMGIIIEKLKSAARESSKNISTKFISDTVCQVKFEDGMVSPAATSTIVGGSSASKVSASHTVGEEEMANTDEVCNISSAEGQDDSRTSTSSTQMSTETSSKGKTLAQMRRDGSIQKLKSRSNVKLQRPAICNTDNKCKNDKGDVNREDVIEAEQEKDADEEGDTGLCEGQESEVENEEMCQEEKDKDEEMCQEEKDKDEEMCQEEKDKDEEKSLPDVSVSLVRVNSPAAKVKGKKNASKHTVEKEAITEETPPVKKGRDRSKRSAVKRVMPSSPPVKRKRGKYKKNEVEQGKAAEVEEEVEEEDEEEDEENKNSGLDLVQHEIKCRICSEFHDVMDCGLTHEAPEKIIEDNTHFTGGNTSLQSLRTLPKELVLKGTQRPHGIGVFAKFNIPSKTQLGPLIGDPVVVKDVHYKDDFRHLWVVRTGDRMSPNLISTKNEARSNWCRYLAGTVDVKKCNVLCYTANQQVLFKTCKDIKTGEELLVYFHFIEDLASNIWFEGVLKVQEKWCKRCKVPFSDTAIYIKHVEFFHPFSLKNLRSICKVCTIVCKSTKELSKHCKAEHGGQGAFVCKDCGKEFPIPRGLRQHRRFHHDVEGEIKCPKCDKVFINKFKLRNHTRNVHAETPFKCSYCKKVLGSRNALNRHVKSHTNNYKYRCDRCGKACRDNSNLKTHMLSHTKLKPYICQIDGCMNGYYTKGSLITHYLMDHRFNKDMIPNPESIMHSADLLKKSDINPDDISQEAKLISLQSGTQTELVYDPLDSEEEDDFANYLS